MDSATVVVYDAGVCSDESASSNDWTIPSLVFVLIISFGKVAFNAWTFLGNLKKREQALVQREEALLLREKEQELALREKWIALKEEQLKAAQPSSPLPPTPPPVSSPMPPTPVSSFSSPLEPIVDEDVATEDSPTPTPLSTSPLASPKYSSATVATSTPVATNRRLFFPMETPATTDSEEEMQGSHEEDGEYETACIVNYDIRDGYEVRWKNCPDSENLWIKAKDLHNAQDAIREFWLGRIAEHCPYTLQNEKMKLRKDDPTHVELACLRLHCEDFLRFATIANETLRLELTTVVERLCVEDTKGRLIQVPRDPWFQWHDLLKPEDQLQCLYQHIRYFLKTYPECSLEAVYLEGRLKKLYPKTIKRPNIQDYSPLNHQFDMIGRYRRYFAKRNMF
jgi:hypothetical protein